MIEHEAEKIRKKISPSESNEPRGNAATPRPCADGTWLPPQRRLAPHPTHQPGHVTKGPEWADAKVQALGDGCCDFDDMDFGDTVPVHPFDVDGRCEFIDGQPVHPLLVAAVLGLHRFDIATLRRYVMTADSRILDYG